jgi:DNA-directed RNA polymerase subunit RPC12/RpoP
VNHSDFQALDEDEVAACPECDATQLRSNDGDSMVGPRVTSTAYSCNACSAHFDEPVVRKRQSSGGPKRGLAKKLYDADPDEVSR